MDLTIRRIIELPERTSAPSADSPVQLTAHAIQRYNERCRPALDRAEAGRDLRRLLSHGRMVPESPPWTQRTQATFSERYLVVGTDIVLPLRRAGGLWVAVTCLVRGCISEATRERRNRRRVAGKAERRRGRGNRGAGAR